MYADLKFEVVSLPVADTRGRSHGRTRVCLRGAVYENAPP